MVSHARSRVLRINLVAADGEDAVAVDEILPIAVEVSSTGAVRAVYTWKLSVDCRGQPTANDAVLTEQEVLISSPAAGGIVRIDRRTGSSTTVVLDGYPVRIVVIGDDLWVLGSNRDELSEEPGIALASAPILHPTVREDGTEGYHEGKPWLANHEYSRQTLERQRELDPNEAVEAVVPVWRVRGARVERVDFGGRVVSIGGSPDVLLVVCRMPDDCRINRVPWVGGVGQMYPASVLLGDGDGVFEIIGKVRSGGRIIPTKDGTLLLASFAREERTLRFIDVDHGRIGDSLPFDRSWLKEYEQFAFLNGGRVAALSGSPGAGPITISVGMYTGRATHSVVLSNKFEWRKFSASSSVIWCWRTDVPQLLSIDTCNLGVREILVALDPAPYAPEIVVPEVDLAAHDQAQLKQVRSALLRTQEDGFGDIWPAIVGVSFESVELVGDFPRTEIVGLFSIKDHPGRRFGRRWRLYDDLGNVVDLGSVWTYLDEDIGTGHAERVAAETGDAEATVWI